MIKKEAEKLEDAFMKLSCQLENLDVGSSSFILSSVAAKCDDSLLEEFMTDRPPVPATSASTFTQSTASSMSVPIQSHLYTAAFWGLHDVVHILVRNTCDINYRNKGTQWTPLHAACFQEHEKVVEILLARGADVRIKDKAGRSCIDFASASDKIWPQFDALKCERTSTSDLVRKGLMRGDNRTAGERTPSLAPTSANNSSSFHMRAALGGNSVDDEVTSSRPPSTVVSHRSSSVGVTSRPVSHSEHPPPKSPPPPTETPPSSGRSRRSARSTSDNMSSLLKWEA